MEEKPAELPVSEQEVQIRAPSFLDKIKIHKFKILGGILGVLIFAGAVFGAYKLGQRQISPGSLPTPTPLPSEVSTEERDETADWEIYRDPDLKYEFRYPPDPLEPSRSEGDTSFVVGYPIKEEYRNDPFIAKSTDKTFWITLGYISQAQLDVMGVAYCGAYPDDTSRYDTSRCESIKIGGADSTIDWGVSGTAGSQASAWIPHPNGGVVTFGLQPVVPESKKVFYQILSTFKFLGEKESAGEKVFCKEPRPQVCTMECIVNPPYICGSDGKSYCSECQACADPDIEWYVIQDELCKAE